MKRKEILRISLSASLLGPAAEQSPKPEPLLRIRGALQIGPYHLGVMDDGTLRIASDKATLVLNIPRPPLEQRTWQVQDQPAIPLSQPESTNRSGDVIYSGGPDILLGMFAHRLYAYIAFGGFAKYTYIVRIAPSDPEFETVATDLSDNVNAIYALPGSLFIVPAVGDAVRIPL